MSTAIKLSEYEQPKTMFSIYKSSAGSGKTYTLVKEYLKLTLGNRNPNHFQNVLAITFTNKAANEMKERVIEALKALSNHEVPSNYQQLFFTLQQDLDLGENYLKNRSFRVLKAILHNYSDFAIGTIDSFVHRIVRTFAKDLKLQLNFEIELDTTLLINKAIDLLVSKIGLDEKLSQFLIEFAQSRADESRSWNIEHDLQKFAKELFKEDAKPRLERLQKYSLKDFQILAQEIQIEIQKYENKILTAAEGANILIEKSNLQISDFKYGKNGGLGFYFQKVSQDVSKKPSNRLIESIESEEILGSKLDRETKARISSIQKGLYTCFEKIIESQEAEESQYQLFKLLSDNLYALALLNEIEFEMNNYKRLKNKVHISEFSQMVSDVVADQPVPFIYERMGERYNHYLIDEFQDTSVLQWQNLLPLLDAALAENKFNMVVGDGKQSIYRFRGGEVEQFAKLPLLHATEGKELTNTQEHRQASLIRNHEYFQLDTNYRSQKEIVEFNNSFFEFCQAFIPENFKNIYDEVKQKNRVDKNEGFVQLEFLDEDLKLKEDIETATCVKTLGLIQEILMDGFLLEDIAILVRSNFEGSLLAQFLVQNRIDVVSAEALLLQNHKVVEFIISVFNLLLNNNNALAKAEILYFIKYELKHDELNDNLISEVSNGAWRDFTNLLFEDFKIAFGRDNLRQLPIYELTEKIIQLFDLSQFTDPYLQAILDTIYDFSKKTGGGLRDFLNYWEENKDKLSISMPEASQAITIMTIHKSKGLQFPIVLLPFGNWDIQRKMGKNFLWVDLEKNNFNTEIDLALLPTKTQVAETDFAPQYEEEKHKTFLDNLNILYVALTRPQERLYIISKRSKDLQNSTGGLLRMFLQNAPFFQEEKRIYQFGIPNKKVENLEIEPETKNKTIEAFISNNWKNLIPISDRTSRLWEKKQENLDQVKAQLLYQALPNVKYLEDVEAAMNALKYEGLIDFQEQKTLEKSLEKLLNQAELKPYFQTGLKVKTDATILLPDGDNYQPNRVVFKDNTITIVDFKIGKKDSDLEKTKSYRLVLNAMGYVNIEQILVYLDSEEIVVL